MIVIAVVLLVLLRSGANSPRPERSSHSTILRRMPRRPVTPVPSQGECLACRAPLESIGVERFRVGGSTGGWKLVFGEFAELGEGMIDMEVLGCRQCRRVELRVPRS
ncbi:MAG TPA: hypothetical protein VGB64_05660 [Actinomycetota bacterium]